MTLKPVRSLDYMSFLSEVCRVCRMGSERTMRLALTSVFLLCKCSLVSSVALMVGLLFVLLPLGAQGANREPLPVEQIDLTELSLEDLMNMPVTSVSKKAQPFSQAAAALFVLTQEDIRRSGATSIPEALRMVPGLQVAKIDSNKWAISARGFNGRFANKLLVLVDGRTVYSPTFAGVNWDQQDTIMEDIARIEIIRGPGATLWGANAVNGVINIITKSAKDTQGGLFVGGAGTEERGSTGVRYGTKLSDSTYIRAYGRFFARDDQVTPTGDSAVDRWHQGRGGLRVDHTAKNGDRVTFQGEYFGGQHKEEVNLPTLTSPFVETDIFKAKTSGGHAMGRWTHTISPTSGMSLQMFYDRIVIKSDRGGVISDTADVNFQHHATLGTRQQVIWGLGYRFVNNQLINKRKHLSFSYDRTSQHFSVWSGFIQDDIELVRDAVTLTLGAKLEHNDFTGFVVQPSARLRWTPTDRQTIWVAVSRAVRTPSNAEDDIRLNQPTGTTPLVAVFGSRSFGNEKVLAYEAGYRHQLTQTLSADLATFYNRYKDLRSFEPGTIVTETSPSPSHLVQPVFWSNRLRAETYGLEAALEWRPVKWWRIQPSYTYLKVNMFTDRSADPSASAANGDSPSHQVSIRSLMSLPYNTEFDLWGRYTDELTTLNIPSYVTLDVRIGWKPIPEMDISLVGQNLLDNHRPEFRESIVSYESTEIQRSVYGKVTWRW